MGLLDSAEEGMIDHKNNGVRLKIVVSDSGVGIDPERLRHIFEPYSGQALTTVYTGGTGLGLSIISSLLKILRKYPSRVRGWERNHLHSHCAFTSAFEPKHY
jgi:K+-sensing histidine kinase KdpD